VEAGGQLYKQEFGGDGVPHYYLSAGVTAFQAVLLIIDLVDSFVLHVSHRSLQFQQYVG
jgi:hypothetical protein